MITSASLIGRPGSARQTVHDCGVDVANGLVLLFGIGTTALPGWDSKMRWNNLMSGLAVKLNGRFKRTYDLTSSIVPRGTSLHRSVDLEFPPIAFATSLVGPAELGVVNPDAVHDHGQPAR